MARIWTRGMWTVKAGHESDFVAAGASSSRSGAHTGPTISGLLRDRERRNVYRTFGSWRGFEDSESFRGAIAPRVSTMDDLLVRFETFTLDEAYPGD